MFGSCGGSGGGSGGNDVRCCLQTNTMFLGSLSLANKDDVLVWMMNMFGSCGGMMNVFGRGCGGGASTICGN